MPTQTGFFSFFLSFSVEWIYMEHNNIERKEKTKQKRSKQPIIRNLNEKVFGFGCASSCIIKSIRMIIQNTTDLLFFLFNNNGNEAIYRV